MPSPLLPGSIDWHYLAGSTKMPYVRPEHPVLLGYRSPATLGFWLHLDVDVISPEWMFAVDSPDPGDLTPADLAILLKTAIQSKHCTGMQVTIYDPTLDPDGCCADLISELLVSALG